MKQAKFLKRDGLNMHYKTTLLPGSRRMPKGFYRDNMRAPK